MHDIDRVRLETQFETETLEAQPFPAELFEFAEAEAPFQGETGEVFGETEQMELASELLEITNEAELDRFLGDLISRAGKAVGRFVSSPEGKALGGVLKGAQSKSCRRSAPRSAAILVENEALSWAAKRHRQRAGSSGSNSKG